MYNICYYFDLLIWFSFYNFQFNIYRSLFVLQFIVHIFALYKIFWLIFWFWFWFILYILCYWTIVMLYVALDCLPVKYWLHVDDI